MLEEEEYLKRIEYEAKFYDKERYTETLIEKTNDALKYLLDLFDKRVERKIGKIPWQYIIDAINEKIRKSSDEIRIVSLGSGPGGGEIYLATKLIGNYVIECLDINKQSIELGSKRAKELGLNMKFKQMDINELRLDPSSYDVVYAHASLHHLINLESITHEIKKAMKPDAEFIVYDGIARNGLRLWPLTKEIANQLFQSLPKQYRYNHSNPNEQEPATELPDVDLSTSGFECIRSEELYPILKNEFKTKFEVFGFSFARRFVDNEFGPNYDLKNPFDKAIIDTIVKLDEEYTEKYGLKPETVYLVLTK